MHKLPSTVNLQSKGNTYETVLHQTQQWERIGELSTEETELIDALQLYCEESPISFPLENRSDPTEDWRQIEECQQWKQELEQCLKQNNADSTFESPKSIQQVKHLQQICQSIIEGVQGCAKLSEGLQEQYTRTVTRTGMLHHDCEQLVHERVLLFILFLRIGFSFS